MGIGTIPPLINAQLSYLLSHSPFPIKVEQIWSGSRIPSLLDRFTLAIPFCLDYIKWDVIYNAQYPLTAPDIIFGPDDENFHPFSGAGEEGDSKSANNSLSDWNCRDPTWLLSLILELRELYKVYQRKRVGDVDDDRLKFEISTIKSNKGIEMYVSSGVDKSEEVRFALPLLEGIDKLVTGSTWGPQQKIYLQVIFPICRKFSNARAAPSLKLVSFSELKALCSLEDMKLPPWLDGMCMAEYLPPLEKLLKSKIIDAVSSIEVRREFIDALAPVFGRPVEADPVFCRKATFLAASGMFTCLVHFTLSLEFPKQQPFILLQSSQHFNSQGAPLKSPLLTAYRWSPRWDTSQMAQRIFDFLVEESLEYFKKYCTETVQKR